MVAVGCGECGCVHVMWREVLVEASAVGALVNMNAIGPFLCYAGNELDAEGGAAIGDGIKSCPELTELNLSSKLTGTRMGRVMVQGRCTRLLAGSAGDVGCVWCDLGMGIRVWGMREHFAPCHT